MKTDTIHKFCILTLVVLTTVSCEMFTNDPGNVKQKDGDADVAITNVTAPSTATLGETVTFILTIENEGPGEVSGDFNLIISDQEDGSSIATQTYSGGIKADSSVMVEYPLEINGETGTHTYLFTHNYEDANPDNDSNGISISVNEQQTEDLAITRFRAPSEVTRGDFAEIELSVTNTGMEDIEDEVTIVLVNLTNENTVGSRTINNGLVAGNSLAYIFDWNTASLEAGEYTLEALHNFEDNTPANNSGTITISVTESDAPDEADIAITSFNAPSSATQGETVSIEFTVENSGGEDVDETFEVTLLDDTEDRTIGSETINGGLMAGEAREVSFSWETNDASPGSHTLIASHDFEDESPANNSESASLTINEPQDDAVDLAFTDFSGPDEATQGDDIDFSVTLANVGGGAFTGEFELIVTDETDETVIHSRTLDDDIEAGEDRTFRIGWDTEDASSGEHTITVEHTLEDENPEDNSQSITITINEPDFLDLSVEKVKPEDMKRDQKKKMTITGTGFRDGLEITFIRNNEESGDNRDDDDDDDGRRDDDDDDDDDDRDDDEDDNNSSTAPSVSDIQINNSQKVVFTVESSRYVNRDQIWDMKLTNPDGAEVIFEKALKVKR